MFVLLNSPLICFAAVLSVLYILWYNVVIFLYQLYADDAISTENIWYHRT